MADIPIKDSVRKMPLNRISTSLSVVEVLCMNIQKCYGHSPSPIYGKTTHVLYGLYFDIDTFNGD